MKQALFDRERFLHSVPEHISSAVELIYSEYGTKIGDFVGRVIVNEEKSNGLPAEEIVAISYSVIRNCERVFNDEDGNFDNYVLRSLRNELIRTKHSKHLLYEDYEDKTGIKFQVKEYDRNESPYTFTDELPPSVEQEFEKNEAEQNLIVLLSFVAEELTPFEKALIYYSFFLSTGTGKSALKPFCQKHEMSYYKVLTSLKKALSNLRSLLETAELNSISDFY